MEELLNKYKSALEKIAAMQPENFDTEVKHWENGNFDDSFDYGCQVGEFGAANIAREALK